ncbi:hypothetical protein [Sphingobacterium anhuiense]|uniref:hypothetical protein n=1 Tax=Sphingobacterium anhuiense TaxID=493780 RepID=UPI003C2AEBA3
MKKSMKFLWSLFLSLPITAFAQTTFPGIDISLGTPAYGINIKTNFGQSGGWSRGYNISNQDGTERLVAFGAFGKMENGLSKINYAYIGRDYNDTFMTFLPNGYVGVGTVAPKEMLSVNGNIRARQIKVETANWPDYVFSENYQLPSLKETEKFIQTNGHLPEVPKASEIEENGVDLGELNKILLKKMEEMTLYMIDKDKRIQALEETVKALKK